MADFCRQCSLLLFDEDFKDLAGQTSLADWKRGLAAEVLCEECGSIQVDPDGMCISPCLEGHLQEIVKHFKNNCQDAVDKE